MKKILLTAAIALASFGVYALPDVPTVTSGNLTFALNLDDILTLTIVNSPDLGTTNFNSSAMFDQSNWCSSQSLGYCRFLVSSNRMFDVTTSLTSITWSQNGHAWDGGTYDVNTVMPGDVIGFNSAEVDPAGPHGLAAGYTTTAYTGCPNPYPAAFGQNTQNVVTNGPWGAGTQFDIAMHAMPGWLYTGGLYSGIFTVTATQK